MREHWDFKADSVVILDGTSEYSRYNLTVVFSLGFLKNVSSLP